MQKKKTEKKAPRSFVCLKQFVIFLVVSYLVLGQNIVMYVRGVTSDTVDIVQPVHVDTDIHVCLMFQQRDRRHKRIDCECTLVDERSITFSFASNIFQRGHTSHQV